MTNLLSNFLFLWKRPKIVIVTGKGRKLAKEAIYQVLKEYFIIGKEILLFESDLKNFRDLKRFRFLVRNSSLPILVVTNIGDIPPDEEFFSGNKEETAEIRKLAEILPSYSYLILNFDDEIVREIKDYDLIATNYITFGFQEGADFRASDIRLNNGTNFKINYKGNTVPIWLDKIFGREQIYASLSAASIGIILDLNLVEISQPLKNYQGIVKKRSGT